MSDVLLEIAEKIEEETGEDLESIMESIMDEERGELPDLLEKYLK